MTDARRHLSPWARPPDARLAALAAALHKAATQPGWRIENADFDARLILAKLPPDWCGHEAIVEDMTTAYMVGEQKGRDACKAEIARLREIEEAVKRMAASGATGDQDEEETDFWFAASDAIAALEGGPE